GGGGAAGSRGRGGGKRHRRGRGRLPGARGLRARVPRQGAAADRMSRWADDPEAAADALILRSLDDIGLGGRILLVNQGGTLPSRLQAQGLAFTVWNRRLAQALPAAAWPASGPSDVALVRLA